MFKSLVTSIVALGLIVVCQPAFAAFRPQHFHGEIAFGEPYEQPIAGGLTLVLDPGEWGWTLKVINPQYPDHDYALVTLPEEFSNPRYIQTAFTLDPLEAIVDEPRYFEFVVSEADYQRALPASELLEDREGKPQSQIDYANAAFFERVHKGNGRLIIRKATLAYTKTGSQKITYLSFDIDIQTPVAASSSDLSKN